MIRITDFENTSTFIYLVFFLEKTAKHNLSIFQLHHVPSAALILFFASLTLCCLGYAILQAIMERAGQNGWQVRTHTNAQILGNLLKHTHMHKNCHAFSERITSILI